MTGAGGPGVVGGPGAQGPAGARTSREGHWPIHEEVESLRKIGDRVGQSGLRRGRRRAARGLGVHVVVPAVRHGSDARRAGLSDALPRPPPRSRGLVRPHRGQLESDRACAGRRRRPRGTMGLVVHPACPSVASGDASQCERPRMGPPRHCTRDERLLCAGRWYQR